MASWAWVPQQQQQRQLHLTTPPPHLFCSHPPTTGRRWCGRLWVAQIEDGQGISLPQRSGVRSRTKRQQPITVANGCSSGSRWVAGWQEMYSGWLLPPTHSPTPRQKSLQNTRERRRIGNGKRNHPAETVPEQNIGTHTTAAAVDQVAMQSSSFVIQLPRERIRFDPHWSSRSAVVPLLIGCFISAGTTPTR